MLKRKTRMHMNTHEYEKNKFMKNLWAIHDNLCLKEKHELPQITH